MDLVNFIEREIRWSLAAFGPGLKTMAVLDHIRKELLEVEQAPFDLEEWVDIMLLAIDGAWRAGHSAQAIVQALGAKQAKNERRAWRLGPDGVYEHVRDGE